MTMKKLLLTAAVLALASCASIHNLHRDDNPYDNALFYQRYLNPNDPFDQRIQRTVDALRANPKSASLHNELGQLLVWKGFPNDAEKEFGRAIRADRNFYPAYYNRAQLRAGQGDFFGARQDFLTTVRQKPGHAEALFQLGLMEEQHQNEEQAIKYYTKAITINHSLLDVRVNPRVLDSKLMPLALLKAPAVSVAVAPWVSPKPPTVVRSTVPLPPALTRPERVSDL